MAGSQWVYLSNGILRKENMTGNNILKKFPCACWQCNFSRFLHCAFDRLDATAGRVPMNFLRFSGFFLTEMGPKVNFDDFLWNHHKGPEILWWFGKRLAVIHDIITFGIDIYRRFPSWDSISGVSWVIFIILIRVFPASRLRLEFLGTENPLLVCVFLCFIIPILGNRYGPRVNSLRQ